MGTETHLDWPLFFAVVRLRHSFAFFGKTVGLSKCVSVPIIFPTFCIAFVDPYAAIFKGYYPYSVTSPCFAGACDGQPSHSIASHRMPWLAIACHRPRQKAIENSGILWGQFREMLYLASDKRRNVGVQVRVVDGTAGGAWDGVKSSHGLRHGLALDFLQLIHIFFSAP